MTNLIIPIDEALLAQLQQRALKNGRDVVSEANALLQQSIDQTMDQELQHAQGDVLLKFFKDIPPAQSPDEELIIEPRANHSNRSVDF